jgi:DNA-binding MarR family transcriptional regulator
MTTGPLPVLLRAGLGAYRQRVQERLVSAGLDDLPRGGPFVFGSLVSQGGVAGDVILQLGISKQAASKLIDTLVVRGYLDRAVDASDRRRYTLEVTERGREAARIVRSAVASLDDELAAHLDARELAAFAKGLTVLAGLERPINREA